jgi:hypothetical protein
MKLLNILSSLFIIGLIGISSCAPGRFIKPLEKGESSVGFNAGGPMILFGDLTIPVPFSALYYGYGLHENGTISGGVHLTSLLYKTLQFDLGYTRNLLEQEKYLPALSLYGGLNIMAGLRAPEVRIYPEIDLNAYWEYKNDRWMSYLGLSNWFDPHYNKIEEGSDYRFWRPVIQLGQLYRFGNWELGLEYKMMGPNLDNTRTVVNYANDLKFGAHGFFLQFSKRF